ncbi:hypothetical protein [Candidatus Methanodesulfokora washburnensis]|uniref:Uncharacterized protein n=1 Tax=Candidatus Methanodesulfokora washburnensis TaxID=2478471 RepID=A0A3R9PT40_9CREN|nr:hypothetical protein [Candidatus Methanodesulfokores washburnensis]RSN72361.1 hypothetical protein D6D85_14090 [Candidatus Methanodesulfokores washburnensis]
MRYAILVKGPLVISHEKEEIEPPEWGVLAYRNTKEECELAAKNVRRIWNVEAICVPVSDPRVKEYLEYTRKLREYIRKRKSSGRKH